MFLTGQSGAGTAITMTLRQIGGAFGVAVLGSLLAQGYTDRLPTTGLNPQQAAAATDSIAGALAVADQLGNTALAASARDAYTHGMTLVLATAAGITLLSAVLIAVAMPGRPSPPAGSEVRPVTRAPEAWSHRGRASFFLRTPVVSLAALPTPVAPQELPAPMMAGGNYSARCDPGCIGA